MTLGAGDVLFFGMCNVTCSGCYLNPIRAVALVTFLTVFILYHRMFLHICKVIKDKIDQEPSTGK
jgi:hypothetical protein